MCEMMKETSSHTPTKKNGKMGQNSGGGVVDVCIRKSSNAKSGIPAEALAESKENTKGPKTYERRAPAAVACSVLN